MKTLLTTIFLSLATTLSFAKSHYIMGADFSYNNVGNTYHFFVKTYFNVGYPGRPETKSVLVEKSNDTVYLKMLFDMRAHFPLVGSEVSDTATYTDMLGDIRYFNISHNTVGYYIDPITGYADESKTDTSWNELDSTIALYPMDIPGLSGMKQQLVVFPNPASDILSIQSKEPIQELLISDLWGREAIRIAEQQQEVINISELPPGWYIVKAFDQGRQMLGTAMFLKR